MLALCNKIPQYYRPAMCVKNYCIISFCYNVQFQKISDPYSTPQKGLRFPRGEGFSKTRTFKVVLWANYYPFIFWVYHIIFCEKIKILLTINLKLFVLVPEIVMRDDWWRHTLNPILYQVFKQSYLGQFAVPTIETWQANSSTGNTTMAITNSVLTPFESQATWFKYVSEFSAPKTL